MLATCSSGAHGAFVYETPNEFLTSGDFNGDGIPDALVLDKLTGNVRVGYADGNANLTWSPPLFTGTELVTGCGIGPFMQNGRDLLAVTSPNLNQIPLDDLSNTNTLSSAYTVVPLGVGPKALAGLDNPQTTLVVASSFNSPPAEKVEAVYITTGPLISYSGLFSEPGPFEVANALDIASNLPSLTTGIVRGAAHDELHLWNFNGLPGMVGEYSNLPPGSAYVFGVFNGEAMPRFVFYQPGGSNLTLVPLLQTNSSYAFGAPLVVPLAGAVQTVFFLANGTNGSALLQFGDGVQGLTLPGGAPLLSSEYSTGTGAAGNVFTGVVPLGSGRFALLDAPPGASSTHAQVIQFDGAAFTQLSSANVSPVSTAASRANVWLFRSEPFVNRNPVFLASFASPDWVDGISGLPGAVRAATETDAGITNGLGGLSTNTLSAPPAGAAFGVGNQYNPAISLFSFSAPHFAPSIWVSNWPPAGPYGSPQSISLTATPSGTSVQYRAGSLDTWHAYVSPFVISNDTTIDFYGIGPFGVRGALQFASYTFGNPTATGTNNPIPTLPDNTNIVAVLSTNQLTISQDGTVFYGRRSAANVGTIWAINLDGSSDTYVTTGVRPRVSGDGRWMAFLREGNPFGNQGNVWIRDLQSGAESRWFANSTYIVGYDWETNGSALLMDYACGIYDLNTNGALTAVISFNCLDEAPARNPVDGRIAFQNLSPTGPTYGIYVTAADGSARQRIVSGAVQGPSWPAWSPDGGDLVFVDGNNTNANSGKNLWLVYPDGTGLLQISGFTDSTNGFPHGAIWTPDNLGLVAAGTIFQTNGLWLIPLAADHSECDGAPIRLPTSPGDPIDFAGSIVVAPSQSSQVSTQPPILYIRQTPDMVVVYWSTNEVGYTLQSEVNPTAAGWTSVIGPYYQNGIWYEYWEPRDALSTEKYFRLIYTGAVILSQPP